MACWGYGCIAVIDSQNFKVNSYIDIPAMNPASCSFAGKDMELFAVTTASYCIDLKTDSNAGFTFIKKIHKKGRKPYLFG